MGSTVQKSSPPSAALVRCEIISRSCSAMAARMCRVRRVAWGKDADIDALNFGLSVVQGIGPRDQIEAMLAGGSSAYGEAPRCR
jgi:hypothetical protein